MRDRIAGFDVEQRDGVLIAVVDGEIDSSNAAELRLALSERLPSASSALVLDLSQVTYLDSSGIQLLFELGRRLAARRQALRLVVPRASPMRRVLELCAVDAVAPMDTEVEASTAARSPRPRSEHAGAQPRRGAADQEARKRCIARSIRWSTSPPATRISPTRLANACSSRSSLRPIGRLDAGGERDHAKQPAAADHRRRDQGPGARAAGALQELRAPLERRPAERAVAEARPGPRSRGVVGPPAIRRRESPSSSAR